MTSAIAVATRPQIIADNHPGGSDQMLRLRDCAGFFIFMKRFLQSLQRYG